MLNLRFAIHVHILCDGIISGYLWIMCLFEGLSSSNLILLSTFPIQNIGIWYILWLRMVNFKIYIKNYFQFLSCNWEIITTFAFVQILLFATSCSSKPFAFCIKEQQINDNT